MKSYRSSRSIRPTRLLGTATILAAVFMASNAGMSPVTAAASRTPGTIASTALPRNIVGTVAAASSLQPISGASVKVASLAKGSPSQSVTNALGKFDVSMPAAPTNHGDNRYEITASAPGYFARTEIVSPPGAGMSLTVRLSPDSGVLHGFVERSDGTVQANTAVRLISEATGVAVFARTGLRGQFALSAPALPSSSATRWYELVAGTRTGSHEAEMLRIEPGSSVNKVLRETATPASVIRIKRTSGLLRVGKTKPVPSEPAPATTRAKVRDVTVQHAKASAIKDALKNVLHAHHLARSPAARKSVQPTPVPSCPTTGSTTWNGNAGDSKWETAGNWSKGAPTSSLFACVPNGSAAITVNSAENAAGLLLGAGNTVEVKTGSLTLSSGTTPSALQGKLTVDSGAAATVGSSALLLNATGASIVNQGSFSVAGAFEQDAGTVAKGTNDGPVDMLGGSTLTFAGTGSGAFEAYDANAVADNFTVSLAGNIASGQSLDIKTEDFGRGVGHTTINAAGSFTNAGTITVEHIGGSANSNLAFNLPSGNTLTNTGTFTDTGSPNQFTNSEVFTGTLTNQDTLNAGKTGQNPANLVFAADDTLVNEGFVTVASGSVLDVAAQSTFENETAGSVTNANTSLVTSDQTGFIVGGTFQQDAGTVASGSGDGSVDMVGGSSLKFGGTGSGAFIAYDANASVDSFTVSLAGKIASGQSLDIKTEDFGRGVGHTTINAAGSFTNTGTITVEHIGGSANSNLAFNLPSGDTLTNTGTFTDTGSPTQFTNSEVFTGNLTNQGTLNAGATGQNPVNLKFAAADNVLNEGAINVLAGSALTVSGPVAATTTSAAVPAASFTNGAGALITNSNTSLVANNQTGFLDARTFQQNAGEVAAGSGDGPVDMVNGSTLSFGGTGSGGFVAYDANAAGDNFGISLSGNLAAGQSLDIKTEDYGRGSGTTTVNTLGSFANAGTISVHHIGNSNNSSLAFDLPAGDTLTNTGTFTDTGAPNQFGNSEVFAGNFTNQGGTLNAGATGQNPANLKFAAGAAFVNMGAVNVLPTSTLALGAGTTFTNATGGAITDLNTTFATSNQNGITDGGSFIQDAGIVATAAGDGPVDMVNGSTLSFGGTGSGAFIAYDANASGDNFTVQLSGDISSGQSLTIAVEDFGRGQGTTTVNAASSFTNAGTMMVEHFGSSSNGNLAFNLPQNGVLANWGTLSIGGDPNGASNSQLFAGSISNTGTFSAASNAHITVTGSLTNFSGSTLQADVLGGPSGVPTLTVNGPTQVGGTLNMETAQNANLSTGQVFDFLNAPSLTGNFDYVTGLFAGGDLVYNVSQSATRLSFNVVSQTTSPEAFGISPSAGPAGTPVTIYGSDFLGASAVNFGSRPGTNLKVISNTDITVDVPSGLTSGTAVPVTVTTPNGTTPTVGAPTFTLATTPSGTGGSASLHLTVKDSAGAALPGVTVGAADGGTHNPLGFVLTGGDGSGTLGGLKTGETVEVQVLGGLSPYGPASAVYALKAETNNEVLTLPIQPLVTSDLSAKAPNGSALAIWPTALPQPGTPVSGGQLSATATMADVQFTLQYAKGDADLLGSDSAGTKAFCVDGNWTLTLSGPAPSTQTVSTSGSGCPQSGGPLNIGTALNLTPGTYGGELTLTAPSGATTAGSTNIYLLPPPGSVENLRVTPGTLSSHAQLGGQDTSVVGQSSTFDVTLGGFPQPGISGYHAIFGWDASALMVTGVSFPTGWGGGTRNNFANGDGGFIEGTGSSFDNVGDTALYLNVTCEKPGVWPISFSGDYWLPQSSAGYSDAVEGSATVVCHAPPPVPQTTPTSVSLDPTSRDVSVTVTGSNLGNAASAELMNTSGTVVSKSASISAVDTTVTAQFPPTVPGLYDLKILDGSKNTVAQTTGTPFEVEPALPQFGISQSDIISNVPGIDATHIYQLINTGTVDGTAVVSFTFPSYLNPGPNLVLADSPPGTKLLTHGETQDGWAEYIAVPLAAGQTADVAWTVSGLRRITWTIDG